MADDNLEFSFVLKQGTYANSTSAFQVVRFHGTEGISELYRFDILLASSHGDVDFDQVVGSPAEFTLGRSDGSMQRKIQGIVAEAEFIAGAPVEVRDLKYLYRVRLAPRAWLLTRGHRNEIFGTERRMSIPAIVEQVLTNENVARLSAETDFEFVNIDDEDYSIEARDYVVQYRESDFDFIARHMQLEGLFFFFEAGSDGEKMIIGDKDEAFVNVGGGQSPPTISFQLTPPAGAMHVGYISELRFFKTLVPQKVVLRDDDYDFKDPFLQEEQKVENANNISPGHGVDNNRGFIADFGDYGKPASIGGLLKDNASRRVRRLAGVRAQEAFTSQNYFTGMGDRSDFLPGAKFSLDGHEVDGFNKTFLLTAVEHAGANPSYFAIPGTAAMMPQTAAFLGSAEAGGYRNRFRAVREEVPYRSPRTISWPRLTGVMNGIVDTDNEDDNGFPQIDELGRYKVRMMFDLSGRKNGEASTYLRMSLPMAGENQGLNFPLQPGTEVLWSCFGGNPDEPVIIGALPNAKTGNVVTRQNTKENRIVTRSGIHFVMVDG